MLEKYLYLFFILYGFTSTDATKREIRIVSLDNCKLSENRIDPEYKADLIMDVYKPNRRELRVAANLTVPKRVGPLKINLTLYEKSGANNLKGLDAEFDCKVPALLLLYGFLGLKMSDDCFVDKGFYTFKDFDANLVTSLLYNIVQNGRYGYKVNFHTNKGSVVCFEAVVDATDPKRMKKQPKDE